MVNIYKGVYEVRRFLAYFESNMLVIIYVVNSTSLRRKPDSIFERHIAKKKGVNIESSKSNKRILPRLQ